MPRGPLCGFFATPTDAERKRMGITDPATVVGCGKDAGEGPLFFFVPVEGGAVRVPVCPRHRDWLKQHHGRPIGGVPGRRAVPDQPGG